MRLRWIFEVPVAVVFTNDRKKLYCQWPCSTTQGKSGERIGESESGRNEAPEDTFFLLRFPDSPFLRFVPTLPSPRSLKHLLCMASSFGRNLHAPQHACEFLHLFGFGQFFG